MRWGVPSVAAAALAAVTPARGWAGPYERLARDFGKAAEKHSVWRAAVLPFGGPDSRPTPAGRIIAERLTSRLLRDGRLEVIERALLQGVLDEARLANTGLLDRGATRELGRILGVEALVAGTVLVLRDGRLEVNARLIDAETARVLAAAVERVDRDWSQSPFDDFSAWDVSPPAMPSWEPWSSMGPGGSLPGLGPPLFASRDSRGRLGCGDAAERAGALERSVVDLKARAWALRLRQPGFSAASLRRNPGSEIADASSRARFFSRLRMYHEQPRLDPLSAHEARRLKSAEDELSVLAQSCGEASP